MEAAKVVLWNSVAAVADDGIITPTLITVGQETIYSKIIRAVTGRAKKGWMELLMFSLLTSQTDAGLGAWYGERVPERDAGASDVMKEAIRPVLSCLFCNYVLNIAERGFHNPLKSFGFVDLLIQLASKDLAYGGKAVLAQSSESMAEFMAKASAQFQRQTLLSRLAMEDKEGRVKDFKARAKARYEAASKK